MNQYFSKASLRVDAKETRELLVNSYKEHQLLWQLFPELPDGERDFIYRRTQHADKIEYYVLSKREPALNSALWLVHGSKPYNPTLAEGRQLAFELRANPVVTKAGSKHDVVMNLKRTLKDSDEQLSQAELEHQAGMQWIQRQAVKHGFEVAEGSVMVSNYQKIAASKPSQSRSIQLRSLDFKGLLTVTDAGKFSSALSSGIGPAKAFGCGLLLVRPI